MYVCVIYTPNQSILNSWDGTETGLKGNWDNPFAPWRPRHHSRRQCEADDRCRSLNDVNDAPWLHNFSAAVAPKEQQTSTDVQSSS